jgi:hypothetical protein
MTDLILKAMIPAVFGKLREAAPGAIAALLGFLAKIADAANVDKVMAWIRARYESLTASIAAWAVKADTVPTLSARFERLIAGAEQLIEKRKK